MRRKQLFFIVGVIIFAIILAGVYLTGVLHRAAPYSSNSPNHAPSQASTLPALDHIFVIIEENKPIGTIIGNASAPYINNLAKRYALATNYYAVAHPSLPNYLALTSGSTHGVTNDCSPPSAGCKLNAPNIADEIEKSHRTWKEYAESMPSDCYADNTGDYATKHNPFIYYTDIAGDSARCKAHIVPFERLASDLRSVHTTPNFAFITPNLCNDMHNCSVATGDAWLKNQVPAILNSAAFQAQNSLLIITWDEGDSSTNRIAAILAGPAVKRGYASATYYDHYALLHTIEQSWQLPTLTANDKQAPIMAEFIK